MNLNHLLPLVGGLVSQCFSSEMKSESHSALHTDFNLFVALALSDGAEMFSFASLFPLVCGSLYELLTGLPDSERPYYFYTDQRFALVLLCVFLILPISTPKEISIQKYIRSVSLSAQNTHTHARCQRNGR